MTFINTVSKLTIFGFFALCGELKIRVYYNFLSFL
jgi:hypothetical protein